MFVGLWATFVYFPVAHWVFAFDGVTGETGGWIANKLKAIDFAGGTAVHINAGIAGLALAIVLGKRKGWPRTPIRPHNLPFVMLGAGLLWFGWYGFNAGSAVSSGGTPASTFVTTTVATAAAMLAWLLVEKIRDGTPPPSVRRPASSRAWSPSPRPAPRSTWSARWRSGPSPACSAHSPSA